MSFCRMPFSLSFLYLDCQMIERVHKQLLAMNGYQSAVETTQQRKK